MKNLGFPLLDNIGVGVLSKTAALAALIVTYSALLPTVPMLGQNVQTNSIVIHEIKRDLSLPLRDMTGPAKPGNAASRQAAVPLSTGPTIASSQPDPVAQQPTGAPVGVTTVLNFDGLNDASQASQSGFLVVPLTRTGPWELFNLCSG